MAVSHLSEHSVGRCVDRGLQRLRRTRCLTAAVLPPQVLMALGLGLGLGCGLGLGLGLANPSPSPSPNPRPNLELVPLDAALLCCGCAVAPLGLVVEQLLG